MTIRSLACSIIFAGLTLPSNVQAQDAAPVKGIAQVQPSAAARKAETKKTSAVKRQARPHVNPEKGRAYTERPKGDLNFELMGEFIGPIATDKENKYESLGLQIRPLANDSFQAIAYFGGLPGQKTYRQKMTKMIGRRSGDFLILSGGPWAIFVEKDGCLIVDRTGKSLGRLERIERVSPTMGAQAPAGAVVMFDGTGVDQFENAEMTKDGLLTEGSDFKPMFQDFNLHVEFRLPYMPQADGQQRGNSGLYLQSRYECQVLDSFGTEPMINGIGALYQMKKPDQNMSFPPLVWQTYDVRFTAPRWSADGAKVRNAHITSWVNGVKVQNNVALPGKTGAGKPEEPMLLPIRLQDHGDPVRYRNIWVIDRGLTQVATFPVLSPKDVRAEKRTKNAEPQNAKSKPSEGAAKAESATGKLEPRADEAKKGKL